MKHSFENSQEKFPHLGNMDPNIKKIVDLPVDDVSPEHLVILNDHLGNLQEQFPNLSNEIGNVREKVELAMGLGKRQISGEVLRATNSDYKRTYGGKGTMNLDDSANDDSYSKAA